MDAEPLLDDAAAATAAAAASAVTDEEGAGDGEEPLWVAAGEAFGDAAGDVTPL